MLCKFKPVDEDAVCEVCEYLYKGKAEVAKIGRLFRPCPGSPVNPEASLIRVGVKECVHRLGYIGLRDCNLCGFKTQKFQLYRCELYNECSDYRVHNNVKACSTCQNYEATSVNMKGTRVTPIGQLQWVYGVTTCQSRKDDLLPRTLASLAAGGFDRPHLFVDGTLDAKWYSDKFGLQVTSRYPNVRTHGNWFLALHELWIRNPTAHRYAIFQDDFVTYRNLRQYLEKIEMPADGYWNLYTFPANQAMCPEGHTGWYLSNQMGRGAVALIFSMEGVRKLLGSSHMIERPKDSYRGYKAVDGGIVTAFKKEGWKEYVHNPSLVQHTGDVSSMGNKPHLKAESFRGEDFDAMELLPCPETVLET